MKYISKNLYMFLNLLIFIIDPYTEKDAVFKSLFVFLLDNIVCTNRPT